MKTKHITFISGYLCSGKSRYGKQHPEMMTISVSGIVKDIIKADTRKELQATAHLDQQIINRLIEIIQGQFSEQLIVDGIRQPSIYQKLSTYLLSSPIEWSCVWIEVPIEICKKRFELKNDGKENISFDEAFQRDKDLGLLDLERMWKKDGGTIIKNY